MTDNYHLCRYLFIVLKKVSPLMQTKDMTRRIFIFQCCGRKFLIPRDARGFHISRRKLSRCDGDRQNFSFYVIARNTQNNTAKPEFYANIPTSGYLIYEISFRPYSWLVWSLYGVFPVPLGQFPTVT